MNLYRLETQLGSYYVIAGHPTEAENKLTKILNAGDYGVIKQRTVTSIHLIATAITDPRFLTDKFLVV